MEYFIGSIVMYGFDWAPRSWAKCDGQLIAISSNTALFSLLGTIYGGDGRTTFALPDLRGRKPIHSGSGPGIQTKVIGQYGGNNTRTLTLSEMPVHNHGATLKVSDANGDKFAAHGNYLAARARDIETSAAIEVYTDQALFTQNNSLAGLSVGNNGGGQSFDIESPYLTVNICIALQGIYPSRN